MENKGFDLRSSGSRRKLKRSLISAFVSLGMVAAVVLPFAPIKDVRADDSKTLTINDGTSTNSNCPVYGVWLDQYTKSQFIIPESDLSGMIGADISKMTFYASTSAANAWTDIQSL